MTTQEMQKEVDTWVQHYEVPYWQPLEQLARMIEETGEIARELNHLYGAKKKKSTEPNSELATELGDLLFTIICLANSQNIELDKAFRLAMDKCYGRDKNRFQKRT